MSIWEKLRGRTRLVGEEVPAEVAAEARSHAGHVRTLNEDRFLSRPDCGLWAVADGMGGHSNGVAAASIAISALEDMVEQKRPFNDQFVLQTLQKSNQLICELENSGQVSGTTIVVACRDGDHMVIYWAGDSRAYRIREGKAQLVTNDHSVVQELIDAGAITKAEARDHPHSHIVTRALGVDRELSFETVRIPFCKGDMILLCSDGLSRSLTSKDLTAPCHSLAHFADLLLGTALHRDGSDNATLVLISRRA